MAFKHQLGDNATDIVTGFTGTITGRAEHLTGCNTYGILAKSENGREASMIWVDEHRITVNPKVKRIVLHRQRDKRNGACGNPKPTR